MTPHGGVRLLLVRHAMPVIDPDIPAPHWHLGPEGRAAARALAPLLARLLASPAAPALPAAHFVSSPEPKAVETLREAVPHGRIEIDAGFAEVHRPSARTVDPHHAAPHAGGTAARAPAADQSYLAAARAYVDGDAPDGWEPRAAVVARFTAAVERHAALAATTGCRTLVVGTHGLASAVWLAGRARRLHPSPGEFWASLRFPDVIELDRHRGNYRRLSDHGP